MATVSGVVRDSSNSLVKRLVRVYERSSGLLLGQVLSDASTGAYSVTVPSTAEVYAVAHDTDSADVLWDKTVLAMHMDDTGLTDVKGHTITLNGSAARSNTQFKFGGYSASIPSSGSYIRVAASADFAFGTGDFDVSFFVYLSASGTQYMMQSDAIGTSGSDKWWIGYLSGQLGIGQHATANKVVYTCTMNTGTWYHVRVCRVSGTTYVFLDGSLLGSSGTFSSTSFSQNGLSIGGISTPSYMTGYIDDLLMVKGAGRSTTSFTAPASAFVDGISGGTENAVILDRIVPV